MLNIISSKNNELKHTRYSTITLKKHEDEKQYIVYL